MEVLITCFHECRHAFQWKVITGDYRGTEVINPRIIEIWKNEMGNYNQPLQNNIAEENYLKQQVEIDAIAFAHKMMLEHFDITTFIPSSIKKEVDLILNN